MTGKAQEVFEAAVGLSGAERDAYLRGACGGEQPLRAENKAMGTALGKGGGICASGTTLTNTGSTVNGNRASTSFDNIFSGP